MRNRNDKRYGHVANPKFIQHQVIGHRSKKKSREFIALKNWNLMGARGFFGWQRNGRPPAGLEEMLHVYRNYHPDHSRYRVARGLQRRRRRTVLRHRLLWRRRTPPRRGCPADSATARPTLGFRSQMARDSAMPRLAHFLRRVTTDPAFHRLPAILPESGVSSIQAHSRFFTSAAA